MLLTVFHNHYKPISDRTPQPSKAECNFNAIKNLKANTFSKMETNLVFEEIYKISMVCLRLNGAHPSVARDHKWALRFIFMHGLFTSLTINCFYNMVSINIKENDFQNACSNCVFMVVYTVVTFQYGVLLWYQKELQAVIRLQQEYFDLKREFTSEEQAIVQKYVEKGQWVTRLWLKSCVVTAIMFPVKSFIDSVHSAYIGDFKLYSFSENTYPGVSGIESRIDIYLLIYCVFFFYAFYCASMYTGFSPIGIICILNACAQLDIVIIRINKIFDGKGFNREETPKELKNIIQFLQKIYSFVDQINEIFHVLYEICIKASAILIPISLYLLIEGLRQEKLNLDYIMFSYMACLLCFLPCYYSDKLKEKGEGLSFAIYSCGWEKFYDKNTRVMLHIMLIRAMKPLALKTVFRPVCLETFAELCKEAYVIFNMMYAVLD